MLESSNTGVEVHWQMWHVFSEV